MSSLLTLWRRVRRLSRRQDGAVLVIVAGAMTMFMAAGAMAIDLGSARQTQTKAQSAADASAEAAADSIGSGGTSAQATTAATSMATANGISSANVAVTYPYNGDSSEVKVTVTGTQAATLGTSRGTSSIPVSASSIAAVNNTTLTSSGTLTSTVTNTNTVTTTQTVTNTTTGTVTSKTCSAAGGNCLAIFAAATTCNGDGSASGDPVVFGGGVTVTGGAWSNGSIDLGGGGSKWNGLSYANGCSVSPTSPLSNGYPQYQQNGSTFNNGYPQATSPLASWPLDYSVDFPSCSGSACTGPSGTPSWCDYASTASSWSISTYNPATMFTNKIYCAVGGGTPGKPTTWTGSLSVAGGGSGFYATFVAGSITVGGGTTLAACGYQLPTYSASNCSSSTPTPSTPNYPLFVAENGTVNESNGGSGLTGDWFVPNGSISVGGGTSFVGFLEAQTVNLSSGGIQGDGPADNGTSVGSTTTTTGTSTSVTSGTSTSLSTSTSTTVTTTSSTQTNGSKLVG